MERLPNISRCGDDHSANGSRAIDAIVILESACGSMGSEMGRTRRAFRETHFQRVISTKVNQPSQNIYAGRVWGIWSHCRVGSTKRQCDIFYDIGEGSHAYQRQCFVGRSMKRVKPITRCHLAPFPGIGAPRLVSFHLHRRFHALVWHRELEGSDAVKNGAQVRLLIRVEGQQKASPKRRSSPRFDKLSTRCAIGTLEVRLTDSVMLPHPGGGRLCD